MSFAEAIAALRNLFNVSAERCVVCGFLGARECVGLISYLKSAKIRSEFLNATVS